MDDVVYIHGAAPARPPEEKPPHAGVIALLERMVESAKRGEIRGLALVEVDENGLSGYSLVGEVGGYSMQGALHCVSAHITEINLSAAEHE